MPYFCITLSDIRVYAAALGLAVVENTARSIQALRAATVRRLKIVLRP
jgi:hypothetical protein